MSGENEPDSSRSRPDGSGAWLRLASTGMVIGLLSLVSDVLAVAQWRAASLPMVSVVGGLVALLCALPATWIWAPGRRDSRRSGLLFGSALAVTVLGSAMAGGGVIAFAGQHEASWAADGGDLSAASHVDGPVDGPGVPGIPGVPGSASADPTASGSVVDGSTTRSGGKPAVHHQGTVILLAGHEVDLDSTEPDWGVADVNSDRRGYRTDLNVAAYELAAVNGAQMALLDAVSYEACRSATGYGASLSPEESDVETARLCVRTGQGRIAAIAIQEITWATYGRYFDTVRFEVTVW